MKTIRTKVYQFSELSAEAKANAITEEVNKFRNYFLIDGPVNLSERVNATLRIEKYNYDFTKDGKRFNR